jgi:hypothetical protein
VWREGKRRRERERERESLSVTLVMYLSFIYFSVSLRTVVKNLNPETSFQLTCMNCFFVLFFFFLDELYFNLFSSYRRS